MKEPPVGTHPTGMLSCFHPDFIDNNAKEVQTLL